MRFNGPQTHFLGRNGYFKCQGVGVELMAPFKGQKIVDIVPITSRGEPGRCAIEVPIEDVPTLIKELQQMVEDAAAGQPS